MSHSGTGPFACSDNRVCRELASASFNHPEIAADGLRPDKSAHDVHIAVLTGDAVRGMTVSRERRRVRGGECETSLRPRIERRVCGIHLRWRCLRFLHNKSETSSSLHPRQERRQDENTTRTCTSAEAPDCCGLLVPISCPGPCCSGPIDLGTLFMGEELLGGLAAAGRWSGAVLITPCRLLRELLRELLGVVFEGPPLPPPPPLLPPPPCGPACAPSR